MKKKVDESAVRAETAEREKKELRDKHLAVLAERVRLNCGASEAIAVVGVLGMADVFRRELANVLMRREEAVKGCKNHRKLPKNYEPRFRDDGSLVMMRCNECNAAINETERNHDPHVVWNALSRMGLTRDTPLVDAEAPDQGRLRVAGFRHPDARFPKLFRLQEVYGPLLASARHDKRALEAAYQLAFLAGAYGRPVGVADAMPDSVNQEGRRWTF